MGVKDILAARQRLKLHFTCGDPNQSEPRYLDSYINESFYYLVVIAFTVIRWSNQANTKGQERIGTSCAY